MRIAPGVDLATRCTLGVGGPARWYGEVEDEATLIEALTWARDERLPVHLLGGGSNIVVADEGFDGLVLRVAIRGIVATASDTRTLFQVGAGEPWDAFVEHTVREHLAGLECLSGIPGQVGATPIQNVGAYGQDVSGCLTRVHVVDRETHERRTLTHASCGFGYRTSRFKTTDRDRFIVTVVEFALVPDGPPTVTYPDIVAWVRDHGLEHPGLGDVREAVLAVRRKKGMVIDPGADAIRSVGSFFVNPIVTRQHLEQLLRADASMPHYPTGPHGAKVPAAWLIEQAGFPRGYQRGSVGISPFQAQALVNLGGARAVDVIGLAADVKRSVWERFGVALIPEPVFVGCPPSAELAWLQSGMQSPHNR